MMSNHVIIGSAKTCKQSEIIITFASTNHVLSNQFLSFEFAIQRLLSCKEATFFSNQLWCWFGNGTKQNQNLYFQSSSATSPTSSPDRDCHRCVGSICSTLDLWKHTRVLFIKTCVSCLCIYKKCRNNASLMQIYSTTQVHWLTNLQMTAVVFTSAFSIFIINSLPVNVCLIAFISSLLKSVKKYQGFQEAF